MSYSILHCIWRNVSNQRCSLLGIDAIVPTRAMPLEGLATKHKSRGISRALKKNQIKYVGPLSVTIDTHGDWGTSVVRRDFRFSSQQVVRDALTKAEGLSNSAHQRREGCCGSCGSRKRSIFSQTSPSDAKKANGQAIGDRQAGAKHRLTSPASEVGTWSVVPIKPYLYPTSQGDPLSAWHVLRTARSLGHRINVAPLFDYA